MKYINAKNVLPCDLIEAIREHVEGVYIYIPQNDGNRKKWGSQTNSRKELDIRNVRIYDQYLAGNDIERIAENFYLSTKSIRRIVLKKRREMEPIGKMINDIIKKNWDLEGKVEQINDSVWSLNGDYVIKAYEDEKNLLRNIGMFKILYEAGIPVPQVIAVSEGGDYTRADDKLYMLTSQLKGKNNIDLNQCDRQWLNNFGGIIGDLHLAFKVCQKNMSFWDNNMLEEMRGWVSEALKTSKVDVLIKDKGLQAIDQLEQVFQKLPRQLIHRDIHLGNFLFDQNEFSGYVDFDLSQSNIRIFDVCYFLLGVLSGGNNTKVSVEKWFEILEEVIGGYHLKLPLTDEELQAVPCVMKNIELLFVAYFINVGDQSMVEDAARIFNFVADNEVRINTVLNGI